MYQHIEGLANTYFPLHTFGRDSKTTATWGFTKFWYYNKHKTWKIMNKSPKFLYKAGTIWTEQQFSFCRLFLTLKLIIWFYSVGCLKGEEFFHQPTVLLVSYYLPNICRAGGEEIIDITVFLKCVVTVLIDCLLLSLNLAHQHLK